MASEARHRRASACQSVGREPYRPLSACQDKLDLSPDAITPICLLCISFTTIASRIGYARDSPGPNGLTKSVRTCVDRDGHPHPCTDQFSYTHSSAITGYVPTTPHKRRLRPVICRWGPLCFYRLRHDVALKAFLGVSKERFEE